MQAAPGIITCLSGGGRIDWRLGRLQSAGWTDSPEKDWVSTTLDHNQSYQSAHSVGFHVCNPISGGYFRDAEKNDFEKVANLKEN